MKFSALVLSLALSTAGAFSPSASRVVSRNNFVRFSAVETAPDAIGETSDEEPPKAAVMEASAPAEVPVDLPVPAEEEKPEAAAPVMASEEASVDKIMPGRYDADGMSVALPMLKRPNKLDGSHAGDFGFDPLGLSEEFDLYTMQEAEIRHARLAMLAVIGWPMAELFGPKWLLQQGGCAPSVLNGFSPLSFLATVAVFGGIGYLEYKTSLRSTYSTPFGKQHREDMSEIWDMGVAGDYNFDPLGLYSSIGDSAVARKGLREVEISHGRSAMLGITGFAAWEALTGHAIVENSMFFHPNLLLPALVAGYVAFNAIYKIENGDRYVFQISKTSEGEAILENARLAMPTAKDTEEAMKKVEAASDAAKKFVGDVQQWYDNINDSYLEYSTSNIRNEKK